MRISVRLKLGLAFAAIIALSATTAVIGIVNLQSLDTAIGDLLSGPGAARRTGKSTVCRSAVCIASGAEHSGGAHRRRRAI